MTDGVQSASCRTISKKVEKGESLIWHSADDKWQDWCLRTPTDAHGLGAKNERARSWPQKRLNKALPPPHLIKDWFHFECAISHKNVSSIYALMDLILPLLFVIFLWRILIRNAWLNRDMALGQYSMEIIDNNFAWFLTSSSTISCRNSKQFGAAAKCKSWPTVHVSKVWLLFGPLQSSEYINDLACYYLTGKPQGA